MAKSSGIFEFERDDETLIVIPRADLRELNFQKIESGAAAILKMLGEGSVKNVVMDFHRTDYYGSTALGFFVKLLKRVREGGGRMAFCRVSEHEREILTVTRMDDLLSICDTRDEALDAVRSD